MADYSIAGLTAAVAGFTSTTIFQVQAQNTVDNVTTTNGTVNYGNIDLSSQITDTIPGFLTGRRPARGQVFPRGVYNK